MQTRWHIKRHMLTCRHMRTCRHRQTLEQTGTQACNFADTQACRKMSWQAHRQTNILEHRHANKKTERHAFKHTSELLRMAKRIKLEAHSLITSHQKHAQMQKASIRRTRYAWNWLCCQEIAFLMLDALSVLQASAMSRSGVHDIEVFVSK